MQPKPPRPTGVTILGVLAAIIGVFSIFGGAVLIALGFLLPTLATSAQISKAIADAGYPGLTGLDVGVLSAIALVLGIVALVLGILFLAVGIGFFRGKGWALTLGMIAAVISLVSNVVQVAFQNYGSILGVIIAILILYYLTRPHVKAFFGKGGMASSVGGPSMGTGAMTSMGSSMGSSSGATMVRCSNCGSSVSAGTTKCPNCGAPL